MCNNTENQFLLAAEDSMATAVHRIRRRGQHRHFSAFLGCSPRRLLLCRVAAAIAAAFGLFVFAFLATQRQIMGFSGDLFTNIAHTLNEVFARVIVGVAGG